MPSVAQIETERLLLRERRDGDIAGYAAFTTDPDFRRYVPVRVSNETPEERAQRSLAGMLSRWEQEPLRGVGWVIARREDDQIIGQGGFEEGEVPEDGEIDYKIGKPFWGQGYGREAAHAMSRFVIDSGMYARLVAYIVPANTGSIRIAEGLGMRYERDVDYLQFFPDPSQVLLADSMTHVYVAPVDEITLDRTHYRVLNR